MRPVRSAAHAASRPSDSSGLHHPAHTWSGMPKTYVLDTSVLLSDPRSFARFEEHEVVVPLVVLTELESKCNHPELGWAARQALRALEDLRIQHGSLLRPLPVNDAGGTLRVELNHQ